MASDRQCTACAAVLPPDARFCHRCGQPQPEAPTDDVAPQPDDAPHRTAATAGGSSSRRGTDDTLLSGSAITLPSVTGLAQRRLLRNGARVGPHYTVRSVLGEGGMGVVYRAYDEILSRTVAIKALHNNLLGDPGIRRRFQREVDLMRTWIHPNVVQVYDFVETPDLLAFVMEYVDGPTLQQHLAEWGGQIPYDVLKPMFLDILDAVGEAHQQGIVHRDLKPDNILLSQGLTRLKPKIVDFGVAKVIEGTRYTVTGALLGTCRYMAPEQITQPEAVDHRADLYALGTVLFQMIAGRVPFELDDQWGTMMAQVRKSPPALSSLREVVPESLESLVMDALSKEPDGRPQSCSEFASRLQDALTETSRPVLVPGALASLPATIDDNADGATLHLVPAGPFKMGPDRRNVFIDGFYMDKYPVTNAQFARFLDVTGYRPTTAKRTVSWPIGDTASVLRGFAITPWSSSRESTRWRFASGLANGCPRKRSGRRPPAAPMGAAIRGARRSPTRNTPTSRGGITGRRLSMRTRAAHRPTASRIWPATYGSGARTCTTSRFTVEVPCTTPATPYGPRTPTSFCAAGRGSSMRSPFAPTSVPPARRCTARATSAFGACVR